MKQYKPGQFVSIGAKLAKIYKHTSLTITVCDECRAVNKCETTWCTTNSYFECMRKLGYHLYPKLIKQCKIRNK